MCIRVSTSIVFMFYHVFLVSLIAYVCVFGNVYVTVSQCMCVFMCRCVCLCVCEGIQYVCALVFFACELDKHVFCVVVSNLLVLPLFSRRPSICSDVCLPFYLPVCLFVPI